MPTATDGGSKMKKKYEKAEIEIIEFETEDVITTSGDNGIDLPEDENGFD